MLMSFQKMSYILFYETLSIPLEELESILLPVNPVTDSPGAPEQFVEAAHQLPDLANR